MELTEEFTLTKTARFTQYEKLFIELQPGPIDDEEEYHRLDSAYNTLMNKGDVSQDESRMISLLAILLNDYQEKVQPCSEPRVLLKSLMERHELTQSSLSKELGVPQSSISEFLSGRRACSKSMARAFGEKFDVSPGEFIL